MDIYSGRSDLPIGNFALTPDKSSEVTIAYIRMLLDQGAPIEYSHHQQMQMLKLENLARYNEIVDVVPELAVNN